MIIINIFTIIITTIILVFAFFSSWFFTVENTKVVIIERFGKFHKICKSGLNFKIPIIDKIAGTLNMRVVPLQLSIETKTKDNVFIHISVSVHFQYINEHIYEAFYSLKQPEKQIEAYIFDAIRGKIPTILLDDVFATKNEIAQYVKDSLFQIMENYGINIIKTLVTDINPNSKVKDAMNAINTEQRLLLAAHAKGEAEKVLRIKQAEAESEANILHGKGVSGQRLAIIEGLGASLEEMKKECPDFKEETILKMILMIQYFDTMKDIGANSKTNTFFMDSSVNATSKIGDEIIKTLASFNNIKDSQEITSLVDNIKHSKKTT
jgi:regulator of protease activity HflC (stomatin/prohibitin superfamily)